MEGLVGGVCCGDLLCSLAVPHFHLPRPTAAVCLGPVWHRHDWGESPPLAPAGSRQRMGGLHCKMSCHAHHWQLWASLSMCAYAGPRRRSGLWSATTAATVPSARTSWWRTLWAPLCSCRSSIPLSPGASSTTSTTRTPTSERLGVWLHDALPLAPIIERPLSTSLNPARALHCPATAPRAGWWRTPLGTQCSGR